MAIVSDRLDQIATALAELGEGDPADIRRALREYDVRDIIAVLANNLANTGNGGGGGSQPLAPVQAWHAPGTVYFVDATFDTVPADTIYYFPITLTATATFDAVGMPQGTSWTPDTNIRLALYEADTDWQPDALVQDFGEMDQVGSTGQQIALAPALTLTAGDYLLAFVHNDDGGPTIDGAACNPPFGNSYVGANINDYPNSRPTALTVASAYGAFADPGVVWDTPLTVTDTGGSNAFFYAVFLRHTP